MDADEYGVLTSSSLDSPINPSFDTVRYDSKRHAYQKTDDYLFAQLIPYIGSKRKLLPLIFQAIQLTGVQPTKGFLDLFAGSGVVGRLAKKLGYRVVSNDWEPYAAAINGATITLNQAPLPPSVFEELNALEPIEGYVTQHFCPDCDDAPRPRVERCFYTRANGMRIDAIRQRIAEWEQTGRINESERNYLLAPLLSCASYVSNTSGLFKAYHAGWGGATKTARYRILSDLKLRPPTLFDNGQVNRTTACDATILASQWETSGQFPIDIAYIDPPYNQHPYGANYHMLNTIALWDKPEVPSIDKAKSAIRTDWRKERRSDYNASARAMPALTGLIDALPCRWALISYSTDGNIGTSDLCRMLGERGSLKCIAKSYKRYRVSSQRMSARALNVEFVLILDRHAPSDPIAADRSLDLVLSLSAGLK